LKLEADLAQKKIRAFMTIEANADRMTTKGRIGWLKNMLTMWMMNFQNKFMCLCTGDGRKIQSIYIERPQRNKQL
jgi:hypothetical protein